ncbi:MAG TPA: hypothetical protein VJ801_04955 [Polyangia bacterium]|nr:hypothetical protein [Polyangia bacterium]
MPGTPFQVLLVELHALVGDGVFRRTAGLPYRPVQARFWMNLRTSLDERRARGVPLAEAKRLLQQRLAVEDRGTAKKRRQARRGAESMREVLDLYERCENVRERGGTTPGELTRKIEAREATGYKRGANRVC